MLFSPECYRSLMMDLHREYADLCHEHGMLLILHCDGDVREFVPLLIEAGFDCLQPLEAKAGMDVAELKSLYGDQIALFGGINTMKMEEPDDEAIETEIREKFAAGMPGGGYLYHSDHSIPKDVSFQKYCFVMDCVKRYGKY